MTTEAPRTLREKLKRTLSPHLEEGGFVGRAQMDFFGLLYAVVILVLVLPLIPFLLVANALYSMVRSFYDPYRRPSEEEY
ncbi:hypothetical protein EFA46_003375 [Halarchaeum sp. CBA1220]|uniref:Uncharacterized protein n=1 Tax=Halarchaeum grantii TaxID=1193105 RepID=A0A830F152_9EURY|nr:MULTISPECIES: hypothetical protein [Halarchaeum]QLC33287.1 hypothetical protein EFA46_003375 [Halarchaeum sp. CBA1220]GGL29314.1 hypothetical protein GCM10009037_11260 [Halarchaeum grantii]